jgi:nucleoside-diphosphate-sugar epimerase
VRVLVTGAGGFLGSHMARDLAAAGLETIALRRREPSARGAGNLGGARLIVSDPVQSTGALPRRVDGVIHLGATSPMPGIGDEALTRDNVAGTRAMIDYARRAGARLFVFASSMSYYGRIATAEVDETTLRCEPDLYGETKFTGENLLEAAASELPSLALRLPGVLGLGARRNFISETLGRMLAGEPVRAFNPDAPFNNAAYAADLSALTLRLLRLGHSGFDAVTVAARGMTTIRAALERMKQRANSRSTIEFRPSDRQSFTVSSTRAIERYGYDPMEIGALLDRYVDDEIEWRDGSA